MDATAPAEAPAWLIDQILRLKPEALPEVEPEPEVLPEASAASLLDAALALAASVPIFACDKAKRPLTQHGCKDASTDPAVVRRMFRNTSAAMIGLATGEASGLIVVDPDCKKGARGLEWLRDNEWRLPPTRRHRTESGGMHLVYRQPPGRHIRNTASKIAPGVDIRGRNGYAIVPPSPGYTIVDGSPPAELPGWLLDLIDPPKTVRPEPVDLPRRNLEDGDGSAYGREALARECAAITGAADGAKHASINKAAYSIGGLVSGGELREGPAFAALRHALASIRDRCQDFAAAERTLTDAFKTGLDKPRQAPPRAGGPGGRQTGGARPGDGAREGPQAASGAAPGGGAG